MKIFCTECWQHLPTHYFPKTTEPDTRRGVCLQCYDARDAQADGPAPTQTDVAWAAERKGCRQCVECGLIGSLPSFLMLDGPGHSTFCTDCQRRLRLKPADTPPTAALHRCTRCRTDKSARAFHRDTRKPNGVKSWCIDCANNRRRQLALAAQEDRLANEFGLSCAEFRHLRHRQASRCAVCREPLNGYVSVDMDRHGLVRGLVCPTCRNVVRAFKGDPAAAMAAYHYLSGSAHEPA